MGDPNKGIYNKFTVVRNDGESEPGQKHHGCLYFVLDVDHDPYAKSALLTYAESCRNEYPRLAKDIEMMVEKS